MTRCAAGLSDCLDAFERGPFANTDWHANIRKSIVSRIRLIFFNLMILVSIIHILSDYLFSNI